MSIETKNSAPQTGAGKTVAVTGASGFIAGVLVRHLLSRGYTVHGTVRSLSNADKVKHLQEELPGVKLFEADLLVDGSFAECFKGCDYIFHTASPFQISVADAETDLVQPAVNGTINVLTTAFNTPTVKRIVLTSSIASIRNTKHVDDPDYLFSEKDWNETATLQSEAYPFSKVMAEKKAWELVEEHQKKGGKVDLVTICPAFVLGAPMSARTDATSIKTIVGLVDGKDQKGVPAFRIALSDVDDIALAHVLAAEVKEANGRYLVASREPVTRLEMCDHLRTLLPNNPIPTTLLSDKYNPIFRFDSSKAAKDLGVQLTPWKDSLTRMAEALVKFGVVSKL